MHSPGFERREDPAEAGFAAGSDRGVAAVQEHAPRTAQESGPAAQQRDPGPMQSQLDSMPARFKLRSNRRSR
jgi:hypothetical protein